MSRTPDAKPPTDSDVAALLGKSHAHFQALTTRPGATCEWRGCGKSKADVQAVDELVAVKLNPDAR